MFISTFLFYMLHYHCFCQVEDGESEEEEFSGNVHPSKKVTFSSGNQPSSTKPKTNIPQVNGNRSTNRKPKKKTNNSKSSAKKHGANTAKELHQLRMVFSNINDELSRIQRLSLGNPRMQSMKESFKTVNDVLEDAKPLLEIYHDSEVPCITKIELLLSKIKKVANVWRPSEKHIEQIKMLLGECDGRVLIVAKYLTTTDLTKEEIVNKDN